MAYVKYNLDEAQLDPTYVPQLNNVYYTYVVSDVEQAAIQVVVAHTEHPKPYMVELTAEELAELRLRLVKDRIPFLTVREYYCAKLDAYADEIRASYLYNGPNSVSDEYYQAEQAAKQWVNAGSIPENTPHEVAVWAEINQQTPAWSANSIITAAEGYRTMIAIVRELRLRGKAAIKDPANENPYIVYIQFTQQLEPIRCLQEW